jgi:thymidylate synthase
MRVINGEDVNELYWRGMNLLRTEGIEEDSRVGRVLVMPEPIVSSYHKPRQRVLLDLKRAANPFFHLFESLWMLAGRDDVLALNRFITDFGTRFAESDGRVHGAYGHRWRKALGFDQLDIIVERLKANPRDRQCVLQMWDARKMPRDDFGADWSAKVGDGCNDLLGDWKDRPCNTHVYFRVREVTTYYPEPVLGASDHTGRRVVEHVLDMLVSCRSNDIVYGAYGANAVHFSILHEYMAGRIGVRVGKMDQMSFNFHAYLDVLERVGTPSYLCTYKGFDVRSRHMGNDWGQWDDDLKKFMLWHQGLVERGETLPREDYVNNWFHDTATPMFLAHFKFKNAMHREAYDFAKRVAAEDWRYACIQWFDIRTNARSR